MSISFVRASVLASAFVVGCGGSPSDPASSPAQAPSGVVVASPEPADALEPEPPEEMHVDDREQLPPDAAAYLTVKPAALDAILRSLPPVFTDGIDDEIGRELGVAKIDAATLTAHFGVDASRPIRFAAWPGDADAAGEILRDAARGPATHEAYHGGFERLATLERPVGGSFRIVIPTKPTRHRRLRDHLVELDGSREVIKCPESSLCKAFESSPWGQPVLLMQSDTKVAVYARQGQVIIDAIQEVPRADDARHAHWLARFAEMRGGPPEACSALVTLLATGALVGACVDADRSGQLGTGSAYGVVVGALAGEAVDPTFLAKILQAGLQEAEQNRKLANLPKRELDHLVVTLHENAHQELELEARWNIVDEKAQTALRKSFAPPVCAHTKDGYRKEILAPLQRALPGGASAFAKPAAAVDAMREAGWGGLLVLAARSWPAVLPALAKEAEGFPPILPTVCVAAQEEELRLVVRGRLEHLIQN